MTRPPRLLGPTLCLALGLVAGCIPVYSAYPLYTAKEDVREPALVGAWGDSLSASPTWAFWPGNGPEYHVGLALDSTAMDSTLVGRLVRLKGVLFLDLYAGTLDADSSELACIRDKVGMLMSAPMHVIFRVECTGSTLRLWHLNDVWFDKYVRTFPRSVRYVSDNGFLLMGTTDEIRAFLSRHLQDEDMFEMFGKPYVRSASAPVTPAGD